MKPPLAARRGGRRRLLRRIFGAALATALAVTLPATLRPAPATAATGDLIINGTFDHGSTEPWWTRLAATRTTVESGQLTIRTAGPQAAPHTWDDLVGHFEFGVTAGQRYRLRFDAAASIARDVRVSVSRVDSPYTSAVDRTVDLDGTTRRFSFDFVSPFGDPKAVLLFHLGARPAATVRLDNVSLVPLPADPATDPVLYWDEVLTQTFRAVDRQPTVIAREAAIMHAAMHDAAVSVTGVGQPYRVRVPVRYPGTLDDVTAPSLHAAVDRAAYTVLTALYPGRSFAAAYDGAVARRPSATNSDEVSRGESVGTAAAEANLSARAADGSADADDPPYQLDGVRGSWRPTEGRPAGTPNWGLVTPFALTSGRQFRPGLPAGAASYEALLGTAEYQSQVQEVRDYGGRVSAARTPEQTQIAFFWANDLGGTYKPPGQLLTLTRTVAVQRQLGILANARLFGLVSLALADAGIAAWDAKFQTRIDLWRPDTAIDDLGDAGWEPLSQDRAGISFSPSFPAYISGHATFAGAWSAVMRRYFGTDAIAFDATTDDPNAQGVVRRMTGFDAAAREDAMSRLYLGVHYRFDADAGLATGRSVGEYVYANQLRP
ncbi:carbohydrate binding domain-containing protein [Micromonospora sp. NPDC004551]|uniref:carbohydrate binding domain-containing protein n=1 Tax=Micromonospora sp. NPDC004551 TaxID=3154284 RepID=UPI00339E119D